MSDVNGGGGGGGAVSALEKQLLEVAVAVEERVDSAIRQMDEMGEEEMEALRERRLQALKKAQQQQQEWRSLGHGVYSDIADEKAFFSECKRSPRVVCHFYKDSTQRCEVVDGQLAKMAPLHLETRFLRLDVSRAPFLSTRLRLRAVPTVAVVRGGAISDYVIGVAEMGGANGARPSPQLSAAELERRLAAAGAIFRSSDAAGDPPGSGGGAHPPRTTFTHAAKKTSIRAQHRNTADSD
uniref:Thioredoxin domain-containing protein 9 isoform X1 n=1 Tax=Petromyzon marinus TaxID=7757 RepID=A0AAJ7XJT2_PETMA|nr:thioredoxin domain-containing protein 9 isoform X1 [Petromyzon marinus]